MKKAFSTAIAYFATAVSGVQTAVAVFPVALIAIVSLCFVFGIPCNAHEWYAACLFSTAACFAGKRPLSERAASAALFVFGIAAIYIIANSLTGPSGGRDMACCHHPAIRLMAAGWNPIHDPAFADGDGQHAIEDIAGVAEMMDKEDSAVFGVRGFSGASVPFRSRFGNAATRLAVFMLCGIRLKDTQTGLRAFPKRLLAEMTAIKGDRYEYETIQIGVLRTLREKILQRPIHTIYIDGNRASHFRPFVDSFRVYAGLAGTTLGCLARFSASSLAAFAIDNAVFTALFLFAQRAGATRDLSIAASIAAARIVSATSNFFLNRKLVFRSGAGKAVSFARYTILALAIMGASCCGTSAISRSLDLQETLVTAAKIVVETILFAVSYKVQKNWVFRDSRK